MSIQHTSSELKLSELDKEVRDILERYAISPKQFVKFKNQFTTKTADNYIIKMILDSEARKYGSNGHLEDAISVYNKLATFIATEDKNNPIETIRNMHRLSLRQYSRLGYNKVRIQNCGAAGCRECKAISDKIVDISEALKKMPLPNPLCSFDLYRNGHSYCRCSYEPVAGSIKTTNKKNKYDYSLFRKYLVPAAILILIITTVFYFINL